MSTVTVIGPTSGSGCAIAGDTTNTSLIMAPKVVHQGPSLDALLVLGASTPDSVLYSPDTLFFNAILPSCLLFLPSTFLRSLDNINTEQSPFLVAVSLLPSLLTIYYPSSGHPHSLGSQLSINSVFSAKRASITIFFLTRH